jgi:hypothetical protein
MRVCPDFAPPLDPPQAQEPPGNRPNQDLKRTSLKQGWSGRSDRSDRSGNGNGTVIDYDDGAWM